jgi:hypothetical protein
MFFLNIKNELTLRLPEPLSQNKTTMSKATKQRKRKDAPPSRAVDKNWLTSLIQQSGPAADVPSKAERIQKRQAKKRRREERQQHHEATPSFLQERRRVEADERSNKNTSQSTSKKLKSSRSVCRLVWRL